MRLPKILKTTTLVFFFRPLINNWSSAGLGYTSNLCNPAVRILSIVIVKEPLGAAFFNLIKLPPEALTFETGVVVPDSTAVSASCTCSSSVAKRRFAPQTKTSQNSNVFFNHNSLV